MLVLFNIFGRGPKPLEDVANQISSSVGASRCRASLPLR